MNEMSGHYLWHVNEEPSKESVEALRNQNNLTRPVALFLANLGIPEDQIEDHLHPRLKRLRNPYELSGTFEGAERLWRAVSNNEKILIYGDYDADGITSSALVSSILKKNGVHTECFVPNRFEDGYGITPESVQKACGEQPPSLIVTVDCGINSREAGEKIKEQGIDLIVTDHHAPGPQQPPANAIINPKLTAHDIGSKSLAGVGVSFKLCHAFLKYGRDHGLCGDEIDLRREMDLVALGTVADIVPLVQENRCMAKFGISELSRQHRPGVRALCEIAGIKDNIDTGDIAFRLAPRMNAAGRMGSGAHSLSLIQTTSVGEALPLARHLEQNNRERQKIEEQVFEQASAQVEAELSADPERRSFVVSSEEWHQGVLGIVASRLVRKYWRPVIVVTEDGNGELTGSGRSIERLNLVAMLEECSQLLTRFGGHAKAAGLSVMPERLSEFKEVFEQKVRSVLSKDAMRPRLEIFARVPFSELTDQFFEELTLLGPFGEGNPEPVFLSSNVKPERVSTVKGGHSKGTVVDDSGRRMPFIAFGFLPENFPRAPWYIAYTPQLNIFRGEARPQLRLLDMCAM